MTELRMATWWTPTGWVSDPGAQRFVTDATMPGTPATAQPSSYASPLGDGGGRLGKLELVLRHENPPPGAHMPITNATHDRST